MKEKIPELLYDVFISYRRKGGAEKAQLVKSELRQRGIAEYRIFLDTHSLHEGDFSNKIHNAITQSKNVVVVISNGCFDEVRETDYWYMEIREALEQSKNIVPVFFDNISSFSGLDIPADISAIKTKNSVTYQHEYASAAFDKLCTFLGMKGFEHKGVQNRGCLMKYRGCMFSIVLVFLGFIAITPFLWNTSDQENTMAMINPDEKDKENPESKEGDVDIINKTSSNHDKRLASSSQCEKEEDISQESAAASSANRTPSTKELVWDWAVYIGDIKGGKPHGTGELRVSKPHKVDGLTVASGDKIKGQFVDGNIRMAKHYKNDGTTVIVKDIRLCAK